MSDYFEEDPTIEIYRDEMRKIAKKILEKVYTQSKDLFSDDEHPIFCQGNDNSIKIFIDNPFVTRSIDISTDKLDNKGRAAEGLLIYEHKDKNIDGQIIFQGKIIHLRADNNIKFEKKNGIYTKEIFAEAYEKMEDYLYNMRKIKLQEPEVINVDVRTKLAKIMNGYNNLKSDEIDHKQLQTNLRQSIKEINESFLPERGGKFAKAKDFQTPLSKN